MRYFVNLPLLAALLCGWALVHLTIVTNPPRSGDAGLGAAFAIVGSSIFLWGLLAVVLVAAAFADSFDWVPAESRGGRIFLVLLAYGVIVLVALLPIGVTMDSAGDTAERPWGPVMIWAARAVAEGLPLLLLVYAAWTINAPEQLRDAPVLRYATMGIGGVLILVAAAVTVAELSRWNKAAAARADYAQAQEDNKLLARRNAFAALTEDDTLLKWYEYSTYASPDDMRLEALRRIGLRANLETELTNVLASANNLWAAEGVRLVADVPFTPSASLAQAVARRLDAFAAELEQGAKTVTYDGDKRLDYYERSNFRNALEASVRVAESAGVDLRPQIDTLVKMTALYPKSDVAHEYPREAEDAKKQIAAALAKRPAK